MSKINRVIIFGATGVQGQPQIWEALKQGYEVRVAARNSEAFSDPKYAPIQVVKADFNDRPSLDTALKDVDAVLLQVPAMGDLSRLLAQCENLVAAIRQSAVKRVVFNSSMWAPDAPCGEPTYDGVLQTEEVFRELPLTVFRPTVFMNNLLGGWIKNVVVKEGVYRYAQKPDLECDWICLEDLAKFMVGALKRDDLIGQKIHVGGPERIKTTELVAILSEVLGREIGYEYLTPHQLGEMFYELSQQGSGTGGDISSVSRQQYVDLFDSFYTFINFSPLKPFQADVKKALEILPVELTDLRTWAKRQDWTV